MLLVANKVDLVHLRKVSEDQGRELAHKLGIPYIETSAKDPPLNIDATFHEVGIFIGFNVYVINFILICKGGTYNTHTTPSRTRKTEEEEVADIKQVCFTIILSFSMYVYIHRRVNKWH